jgi:hypothetical protein
MKIFKNKKLFVVIVLILIILVAALLSLKNNILVSRKPVRILEYGFSICTMDVPSSSCGPYEVKAQLINGEEFIYKVDGFDNRKSERYDDITSRITKAKKQNTIITLKINDKGYIVAVE